MLHEAGNQVYAADSVSYALTKASNSIEAYCLLPSPKWQTKAFISSLLEFIQIHKIEIVIPTCEESFYISMYKENLSRFCEVFVGNFDHMKLLHNKFDLIQYVNQLGLKTPKTSQLSPSLSKQELQNFFDDDLVMKRIYSRFSDQILFLHKNTYEPAQFNAEWIAQEKVAGIQYCSYSVVKNGTLLAHAVYPTVFTAGLGATIAFHHSERKDIETFVKTIVADLHFTGQISFDFIVNEDNMAIPIECNPRATSGLHLFNQKVIPCFLHTIENTLYPEKETKVALTLAMITYAVENVKRSSFTKWLYTLFTHRDITWWKKDIKPFFYQFISMYTLWKESKQNNRTMIQQSTSDISWDGEII